MSYQEFSMKRTPPKLSKGEIDATYLWERNNGRVYISTINGPQHISDWRDEQYEKNGIDPITKKDTAHAE